jgi:hypothetical protein
MASATGLTIGSINMPIESNTATLITAYVPRFCVLGSNTVTVTTAGGSGTSTFTVVVDPIFVVDANNRFGDFKDANGHATQVTLTAAGAVPVDTELTISGDVIVQDVVVRANTAKDGSGTNYVPLVDSDGHLQVDTLSSALPAGAATETTLAAVKTAVEIMDDWDDSNYCNVNINLAGTDAPSGAGTESGVLRVTLANDSTGLLSVDDNGSSLTVDNGGTFAVQADCTNTGTFAVQAAPNRTVTVTNATGVAAISVATALAAKFRLSSVTCHLSGAGTNENFTITVDANDGADYDTLMYSTTANGVTDFCWIPDNELLFEAGDNIVVALANSGGRTYGVRIVTEVI